MLLTVHVESCRFLSIKVCMCVCVCVYMCVVLAGVCRIEADSRTNCRLQLVRSAVRQCGESGNAFASACGVEGHRAGSCAMKAGVVAAVVPRGDSGYAIWQPRYFMPEKDQTKGVNCKICKLAGLPRDAAGVGRWTVVIIYGVPSKSALSHADTLARVAWDYLTTCSARTRPRPPIRVLSHRSKCGLLQAMRSGSNVFDVS